MTQPPFEPRLADVGPEDEVSLLLSDARTRAQSIIDESIERAQELLRGEPAPQAFERLRRTVNDMAVDVRAIHSRLDEIESLIRGVGVAYRTPGYPPVAPPPPPAPPTYVVPPGYAPAPVYYAPAPMPTPPVAPVPAPVYAPQPEAPAPPAPPVYEAPLAPPPIPEPVSVPPVEVAAAPPPPIPTPPPMEPAPAPVAPPPPVPVAPAPEPEPEPVRSEAPPASAIPPQRPTPPEPVAPSPPVALTPPTPVAPPPPVAPRVEEPVAPPPPPMAAVPAPTPAAPEPQPEPAASEGFDPEGGSIALRVSPVAGFQGLMRVQDALGRCRGVREAGVEAYAQGEARLRLHLSDRLSGDQLAKALGEILGRGARVASESISERAIQLTLE